MNYIKKILQLQHRSPDDEVFRCKGVAMESVLLYASKYKEDVENEIKQFSQYIWSLCANANDDPENDEVVLNCLKYFKSLIMWNQMKQFFTAQLANLIENIVLPNITPNINTFQQMQSENETFIDFNFRNAEIGTRKASAVDLIRAISRHYPDFEQYLDSKVDQCIKTTGGPNIKANMSIIALLIEGGSKAFRDIDGTTQLFVKESIILKAYQNIVKPYLASMQQSISQNPDQEFAGKNP